MQLIHYKIACYFFSKQEIIINNNIPIQHNTDKRAYEFKFEEHLSFAVQRAQIGGSPGVHSGHRQECVVHHARHCGGKCGRLLDDG